MPMHKRLAVANVRCPEAEVVRSDRRFSEDPDERDGGGWRASDGRPVRPIGTCAADRHVIPRSLPYPWMHACMVRLAP